MDFVSSIRTTENRTSLEGVVANSSVGPTTFQGYGIEQNRIIKKNQIYLRYHDSFIFDHALLEDILTCLFFYIFWHLGPSFFIFTLLPEKF